MCITKVLLCALLILSKCTAALAMRMLVCFWQTAIVLSAWLKWNQGKNLVGKVYDIVDAGPRHRFAILSAQGQILAHNCLAIQFGAGYKSIAAAVRNATKNPAIEDEQGRAWLQEYADTYPDYSRSIKLLRQIYQEDHIGIMLRDGWRMGPDNPSAISAGNLPVQGHGGTILRSACRKIDAAKINIIATLHDAITMYVPEKDAATTAARATALMKEASFEVLGIEGMKVGAPEIIRHGELWLHSGRAKKAWKNLEKYFVCSI